jgi:hypothetical protein
MKTQKTMKTKRIDHFTAEAENPGAKPGTKPVCRDA